MVEYIFIGRGKISKAAQSYLPVERYKVLSYRNFSLEHSVFFNEETTVIISGYDHVSFFNNLFFAFRLRNVLMINPVKNLVFLDTQNSLRKTTVRNTRDFVIWLLRKFTFDSYIVTKFLQRTVLKFRTKHPPIVLFLPFVVDHIHDVLDLPGELENRYNFIVLAKLFDLFLGEHIERYSYCVPVSFVLETSIIDFKKVLGFSFSEVFRFHLRRFVSSWITFFGLRRSVYRPDVSLGVAITSENYGSCYEFDFDYRQLVLETLYVE